MKDTTSVAEWSMDALRHALMEEAIGMQISILRRVSEYFSYSDDRHSSERRDLLASLNESLFLMRQEERMSRPKPER